MRTETKWAVIATIAILALFLIGKVLGLQTEEKLSTWQLISFIFSILLYIAVYFMVTREKREHDLRGIMSYKQGFWAAAIMTLIFIPLSTLVIYIFVKWISPDFAAFAVQMGEGADFSKTTMNHWLATHVGFALMGGLLFSLLFPLFTKRSAA